MADDGRDASGPREVVVPLRVYKTVTVLSTLFAVVAVVAGFLLVDVATERASVPVAEIDPVVALLGIAAIALGAGTYALGTRFRTAEMGKHKTDSDATSDDG